MAKRRRALRPCRVQSIRTMGQEDNSELNKLMLLLDLVVKESGHTYLQVEERLSWSGGTLSRLLSGGRELKLRQLLGVLRAVGMRPSRFFVIAEEHVAIERSLDLRATILNSIMSNGVTQGALLSDEELEARIERVIYKLLASRKES